MTKTTNNLAAWLVNARGRLAPSADAGLEAALLAAHVLQRPRAWIMAHPEFEPDAAQTGALDALLERLAAGEPLPYLTGQREFFGLEFTVTPAVLVPRPETELLVEHALAWLRVHPERRRAADVGTGSGCIAVSLAAHTPGLRLAAVDRSFAALAVARANAARHRVSERLDFVHADLLGALAGPFDLVCANLPYIPAADVAGLPVARCEPRLALAGGPLGSELISALLHELPARLAPGGLALFEIEYRQGQEVSALARACFPGAAVSLHQDLAGLDRLVAVQTA